MVFIDSNLCKGCMFCVKFCPKKLLEQGSDRNKSGYYYPFINNPEKCVSCCQCAVICPEGAIEILKEGK